MKMIWARGIYKNLQKRRTRAVALPEVAATRLPHSKHSDRAHFTLTPARARASARKSSFLPRWEIGELR